jgi:hypothetical protein
LKLTELTKKTRKIVVEYLGETAEVEYKLAAITPGFLIALKGLDTLDSIIQQVGQTVIRWDVTDENGREIPATDEAIRKEEIPVGFLTEVLSAIAADMDAWSEQEKKA